MKVRFDVEAMRRDGDQVKSSWEASKEEQDQGNFESKAVQLENEKLNDLFQVNDLEGARHYLPLPLDVPL